MYKIEFFPGSDQFFERLEKIFDDPTIVAEHHKIPGGFAITYREITEIQSRPLDALAEIMKNYSKKKEFCRICREYADVLGSIQIDGQATRFEDFLRMVCE